ncbi:ArnT family glycosyltransferase [Dyella japonica]|uniref:ArnT family glycosyltransferase n=1 Tax=Dyella japonica TaxID=231455 RepID=UPI000A436E2A|nr:glycosyltransferase family 39 protein [Dyella japonica]
MNFPDSQALRTTPYERLAPYLPWAWLPLWIAAALVAIFQHGPMPMYSTRTLSVAWEMWTHHSVLVPYLNGLPYSDKPPLLLWLIQLGWAIGGVGDVWPRLLEVALGALQLVLAWRLARRLFPQNPLIAHGTAWILLALTYGFLFGLQVMYEVLLADCVLAALLCLAPSANGQPPQLGRFALALSLGLLTKGPVMLLHVGLPWLLGPLWSECAHNHARRWYVRGGAACAVACAVLLTWALLAAWSGGVAYRHTLLVHQTAGRVVDAFAHAQPFWWYLPLLPVLVFPFALWPRIWLALASWRHPLEPGVRFLLAWLVPVFLAFSMISGKQAYYLLPEFAGFAMLIAASLARLSLQETRNSRWWSPWPLALLLALAGVALMAMDGLVAHGHLADPMYATLATHSRPFGALYLLLALALALPRRGELYRVAGVGLLAVVAANGLFSMTLWPAYDFTPVARLLATAQQQGRAVANFESNDGQYTFLGRLTEPVASVHSLHALSEWARQHPEGLVIIYPRRLSDADRAQAIYTQPFRGISLAVWPAQALVQALPQEIL